MNKFDPKNFRAQKKKYSHYNQNHKDENGIIFIITDF